MGDEVKLISNTPPMCVMVGGVTATRTRRHQKSAKDTNPGKVYSEGGCNAS